MALPPELRLVFARPSLLTIRQFDITFIIPWKYTWFSISTHIIENPLHVLPDVHNREFTVHCRAVSGIPVITMVLLAGSVGWPPGHSDFLQDSHHIACTKNCAPSRPNFKSMEIELLDLKHIEERQKMGEEKRRQGLALP